MENKALLSNFSIDHESKSNSDSKSMDERNFSRTHNKLTPETCVGVVKAPGLHHKSPVQHYVC